MTTEHEGESSERRLGRGDFIKLSALTLGSGVLAACGAEGAEEPAAQGTQPQKEQHPPIEQEPGDLEVFEWAGYEYPAYGGKLEGQQYFIPADWGFSSPLYRADKVEPEGGEDSWTLFYDERYKGKISWWDSPLENFVIWGYVNGVDDPWNMTEDELDEAKDFLISKKHLCRNFWSSQTDLDADFAAGNVWIAYAWGGSFQSARKAGLDVKYSDPKEGRLGWNCGFVLIKDTDNFRHAHAFIDAWSSKESAEWIINNYAYGHANTAVDLSKVPEDYVKVFHLDDPKAREEPNAHYARPVTSADRSRYAQRWDEVKAA